VFDFKVVELNGLEPSTSRVRFPRLSRDIRASSDLGAASRSASWSGRISGGAERARTDDLL